MSENPRPSSFEAGEYVKRPIAVRCDQWWMNGDHPQDRVGKREIDTTALLAARPELLGHDGTIGPVPDDAPTYVRQEGAVVRFFRRPEPEYDGDLVHPGCGRIWQDHGWIDTLEGGHTVCPGDVIITGVHGERYPCKPDIFAATYEAVTE